MHTAHLARSIWALALAIVLTSALTVPGIAQNPSCTAAVRTDGTPLDSAIVAAMHEHNVPGAAIVVVRDGAVDVLRGYGCADLERDVPVDPRTTVFRIASVSKSFVATATLVAAERGLVDLRTDVNRYLRGLQVPTAWDRPITLHHLLTHTAGFEESVVGYAARTPADIRPLGEFLAAKLPQRGWPPGDVTSYSNYGYALAGYVVESAASTSFADYVQREVLSPLGMTRSSFAHPLPPELERDLATSHRCTANGCAPAARDYRSAYPPGGLATTADDVSRFLLAQLGLPVNGRRVLSDSVLGLMRARQFSHHPRLPGLTYGFVEEGVGDERALTHAGAASGFTSFVVIVPGRQFAAFVVANGGSSRFGAAARDAMTRTLAVPEIMPHPRGAEYSSVNPAGSYRLTRYARRGVENLPMLFSGQLHVVPGGGDTIAIVGLGDANGDYVPEGMDVWTRVGGHDLVAVRTENGAVTHLFGSQSFFGTRFPAAYERLAWYDAPGFLNEALSYTMALPLLALVVWPIVAGVIRWRRRRLVPTHRTARLPGAWRSTAMVVAVVAAALTTWFGFGFIAASNRAAERGGGDLVYGLPPAMQLLAWAPSVLALLAVLLVLLAIAGWRRRWWSVPGRLLYTVIAINVVLFVAILVRWGYFPVATG